jgi:2-aminoethylphosphonate-pyruvate transaminase
MKGDYLLLTPGPLTTSETVRNAMLKDWCTWDKDYNEGIVSKIRKNLLQIAQLDESIFTTILLQGSGSYCVEATIGATVKNTDKLLILANGAYGNRMSEIARYYNINQAFVTVAEDEIISPELVEQSLNENEGITHVAIVHCETTTGILNPIEEIASIVKSNGLIFIVDAMSSFGGIPIDMAGLGIDFLVSSSNKCIQGVPGFGFVIAKKEELIKCKGNARSLSLDIYDQWETMEKGGGKWRFTSPTHVVRAFYQALEELEQEGGIAARYERYKKNHATLVNGMRKLGFQTLISDNNQSCIITSFLYPSVDFNFEKFYYQLKEVGFVIYPGKISNSPTFRIGNIGDVYPEDFERLVQEIAEIIN